MKVNKRRRIENKTNYKRRLGLLKSNSLRLVIRKTNKYLTLQIIESRDSEDKVVYSATTKDLLKLGWSKEKEGSLKSTTASYLAGLLLGKKAKDVKGRLVLDLGLIPNTKGSRVYAAVKGIADSGIKINYDEKVVPSKESIEGKNNNLTEMFSKVKGAIK
ncbi:MAG: 50S ribosomal protein L18 [Candidatus Pacearchaeota archaeon]|jgi:large subunit ribosomal protein L18